MCAEKKILVIGELDQKNKLTSLTSELLGGAAKLADQMGGNVDLLLMTSDNTEPEWESICRGAYRTYVVAHPGISVYDVDTITSVASKVCVQIQPILCVMGQTDLGRDVAPRMAARLDAGLCMDCTDVKYDVEHDRFVQTRPAYGGKAMVELASTPGQLQIDTVRAKSMSPLDNGEGGLGEKVLLPDAFVQVDPKVKLVNCEKLHEEGIRLEDAKVIVSGGGGLGGKAGFRMLGELARLLNAAVGATRVPVDEKWVPHHMEIGQTGKIVSPDLYIAVGISGATQHITGCSGSGKIVAINKDPDANIFRVADYGLVADYKEALPALIEKLGEKAR